MSTFDDPFDPTHGLRQEGCACGRHRRPAEHDYAAQRQLQCAAVESNGKRYEGVVASASMRAMFPKIAARRGPRGQAS